MDQILKIKLGREVKDYLSITFGLICYALGWAAFLLPYQITTGGVTGISALYIMLQALKSRFLILLSTLFFRFRIKDTRT